MTTSIRCASTKATVLILALMLASIAVILAFHTASGGVAVGGATVERSDYRANVQAVSRGFAGE
jgi:hypothetical protein